MTTNELAIFESALVIPAGGTIEHGPYHQGHHDVHYYITFTNGFRLSVIKGALSYGVEAGLMDPTGQMMTENTVFNTGDSVEGFLSVSRLQEIIDATAKL